MRHIALSVLVLLTACSTPTSDAPSLGLLSVAFGDGGLVAGEAGGALLTSPDGLSWEGRDFPDLRQPVTAITWDAQGSRYLAVSSTIIDEPAHLLESPDGNHWRIAANLPSAYLTGLQATESGLVAVGDDGLVLHSDDGLQWTPVEHGLGDDNLTDLVRDGTRLIATGTDGRLFISEDAGATWSTREVAAGFAMEALAGNGQRYVAVGAGGDTTVQGGAYLSDDGLNWRAVDVPALLTLLDVAWGDDRFLAVGFYGEILESPDGETWRTVQAMADTLPILTAVAWDGSAFVIVGHESTILRYRPGHALEAGRIHFNEG